MNLSSFIARSFPSVLLCACALLLGSCSGDGVGLDENGDPVSAEPTVTINPVKDNTLYDNPAALSNGAGDYFFAGKTSRGPLRRGLVAFDVAGAVPAGATITSVTLTLHLSRKASSGGVESMALHAVTADWGEGTSNATGEEGKGAPATPGDATWNHAFFDTTMWASAGGDFSPTPSATQTVDGVDFYSWSGTQMVSDVQSWLDAPAGNFGWILIGDEATNASAKRFDARENPNATFHPELVIQYIP